MQNLSTPVQHLTFISARKNGLHMKIICYQFNEKASSNKNMDTWGSKLITWTVGFTHLKFRHACVIYYYDRGHGSTDRYQPALTCLIRNVWIIFSIKVGHNLPLKAWCMLTPIATMHLLTPIHRKDYSIKHCIQLPYLVQKISIACIICRLKQ